MARFSAPPAYVHLEPCLGLEIDSNVLRNRFQVELYQIGDISVKHKNGYNSKTIENYWKYWRQAKN